MQNPAPNALLNELNANDSGPDQRGCVVEIAIGCGGILLGSGGGGNSVSQTFIVTGPINNPNVAPTTREVTLTGRRVNGLRNNIGTDRVLGRIGAGLELSLYSPHRDIHRGGICHSQWRFEQLRAVELYRPQIRFLSKKINAAAK